MRLIKESEKVFEELDNGNRYRIFAQNLAVNGGSQYQPLTGSTPARISNSKQLQDADGNVLGAGYEKCSKTIITTLSDIIEMSGGDWGTFALAWAEKMVEVPVVDEV